MALRTGVSQMLHFKGSTVVSVALIEDSPLRGETRAGEVAPRKIESGSWDLLPCAGFPSATHRPARGRIVRNRTFMCGNDRPQIRLREVE